MQAAGLPRGTPGGGTRKDERVIMTALRNGQRVEIRKLAKAVNLTPQALTRIIDELDRVGLVSRRGRRLSVAMPKSE